MYATSPGFDTALKASTRTWACQIEVLYAQQRLATLTTVQDGSVTLDDTAVRRTLDLTIADLAGDLTPTSAKDLLAPRGTELRVSKGLLVNGAFEYVPLGVFGITAPEIDVSNGATLVKLSGKDRADAVRKRRFATPYSIARGTNTAQAIATIVTSRMDVPVRITATSSTTPAVVYDALSDPWDAIDDLAGADSLVAYFDPLGTFVVAPDTEALTGVTYGRGGDDALLLSSSRALDAETTYSGVVVTSSNPDIDPIQVITWDTDPASPTYADGPFGRRPYGFASPIITTLAQAQASAATLMKRVTKMPQSVAISTIGHPGHEIGDLVTIEDITSQTSGNFVVRGGQVPLRPGNLSWKLQEDTSG